MFKHLNFQPLPGLASPHMQMFLSNFGPTGNEPSSAPTLFSLTDGDRLSCQISTPKTWKNTDPTSVLVHGVGGSHQSPYMVRMSRKLYNANQRVVRINLRGAGSGAGLCKKPYNCGSSHDVWSVLHELKKSTPQSSIQLTGFSLGGALIIKMAGEQGEKANNVIDKMTAVCPVLDLIQTVKYITDKSNWLYHRYYLKKILEQGSAWVKEGSLSSISSIKDFDDTVTAPLWGYQDANDYYRQCSSLQFLPDVKVPCNVLLAADDPFIDHKLVTQSKCHSNTNVWLTSHGAHMGFLGSGDNVKGPYWMDNLLLQWNS